MDFSYIFLYSAIDLMWALLTNPAGGLNTRSLTPESVIASWGIVIS